MHDSTITQFNDSAILKCIRECCSQHETIVAAYLFGSAATGKIHPSSDVDIALLVERAAADDFPLPSFVASIEPACGCPLDVVLLNRAGEVLKHQVRRHGKLLFERDPDKRKHFEIISRKLYEDFLYLHRKYVQTVLYGRQGFKSPGQELNG